MIKKTIFALAFLLAVGGTVETKNYVYAVEMGDTPQVQQATTVTKSADNSLAKLELSSGSLSPSFVYNVTNYTATVDASVSRVDVTAVTSNKTATIVSISGNENLVEGENKIQVVVKAENEQLAYYTITVTKTAQQEEVVNVDEPEPTTITESNEGDVQNTPIEDGGITENKGVPPIAISASEVGSYNFGNAIYTVSTEIQQDLIPENFEAGSTIYFGESAYPALQFIPSAGVDIPAFVGIELVAEESGEAKLFAYDTSKGFVYGLACFSTDKGDVYPAIPADELVPATYTNVNIDAAGAINLPAYEEMDADRNNTTYYLYCVDTNNEGAWYTYDSNTQQMVSANVSSDISAKSVTRLKEKNAKLQLKNEQLQSKMNILVYIFIFVVVALVLIICSLSWTKRRQNRDEFDVKDDTKEDAKDDIDDDVKDENAFEPQPEYEQKTKRKKKKVSDEIAVQMPEKVAENKQVKVKMDDQNKAKQEEKEIEMDTPEIKKKAKKKPFLAMLGLEDDLPLDYDEEDDEEEYENSSQNIKVEKIVRNEQKGIHERGKSDTEEDMEDIDEQEDNNRYVSSKTVTKVKAEKGKKKKTSESDDIEFIDLN